MAYQLELPLSTRIHNVFHVSQLKVCTSHVATPVQDIPTATVMNKGIPKAILERKMVKRGRVVGTQVLVKWKLWRICNECFSVQSCSQTLLSNFHHVVEGWYFFGWRLLKKRGVIWNRNEQTGSFLLCLRGVHR